MLLYPQWLPGTHSPGGPISRVAGVITSVDGTRVQWIRDQIHVYAFHVPLGGRARSVEVQFDYLTPVKMAEGRIERSDAILDLEWNEVVMYPAGFFSRDIPFDVTLKLPQAWKYATALETASEEGSTVKFKRTTLNTLVDSPLYAGSHFKRVDLSPAPTNIVRLTCSPTRKRISRFPRTLWKNTRTSPSKPASCTSRIITITTISCCC